MEYRGSNNSSVVSQLSGSSKTNGDGREEDGGELSISQGDISVHRENWWGQGSDEEDTQVLYACIKQLTPPFVCHV